MIKTIYVFCTNFSIALNKKNISDYAASAAFFLFLSFIPEMMIGFAALPYTMITEEQIINLIVKFAPDQISPFICGVVNEIYLSSSEIITASIIVALWSAGKCMQSLIRGLNSINDIEENRSFFVLRAIACLYTVVMLIAAIIMIALLMFGRELFYVVSKYIPQIIEFKRFLLYIRYPFSVTIFILIFEAIYCIVPSKKQNFFKQLPGAFLSAVAWSVASWVFTIYLKYFDGFSSYGSMATIIIVMVYMYMMMYIILIGAYLNQWLGRSVSNT